MRCLTSAQTHLSVLFSLSELTEAEVAPFLHPIPEVWHVIQGNVSRQVPVPVHFSGALAHGYTAQPLKGS